MIAIQYICEYKIPVEFKIDLSMSSNTRFHSVTALLTKLLSQTLLCLAPTHTIPYHAPDSLVFHRFWFNAQGEFFPRTMPNMQTRHRTLQYWLKSYFYFKNICGDCVQLSKCLVCSPFSLPPKFKIHVINISILRNISACSTCTCFCQPYLSKSSLYMTKSGAALWY